MESNIKSTNEYNYTPAETFIQESIDSKSKTLGFENYYDMFAKKDKLKLLDLHGIEPVIPFRKLVKYINSEGTVSPDGKCLKTPKKILVELKPHQMRTLYEMVSQETSEYRFSSSYNVNLLCDNVGSGKSLCILSLIAEKPTTYLSSSVYYSSKKETHSYNHYGRNYDVLYSLGIDSQTICLKTNLIIVPHNIFLQWKNYIETFTKLKTYFVAGKKNYTSLCSSKTHFIEQCDKNDIILVKSTMYKKLYYHINTILNVLPDVKSGSNKEIYQSENLQMSYKLNKIKQQTKEFYKDLANISCKEPQNLDMGEKLKKRYTSIKNDMESLIDNNDWNLLTQKNFKRLSNFKYFIQGYCFERIIVDEVDSIKIPAFPYMYAKQIWYITSSINNVLYPYGQREYNYETHTYKTISAGISGTGFLKNILANMFHSYCSKRKLGSFRGLFNIIRNNNKFIEHSIHIPEPVINFIECYTPPHLIAIKNAIDKEALKAFNAGDTKKAIEILGCEGGTEKELIEQITQKLKDKKTFLLEKNTDKTAKIVEYTKSITELEVLNNPLENDPLTTSLIDTELIKTKKLLKNCKLVIKSNKEKIVSIEAKIKGIEERLGNVESKNCPICYCNFAEPAITPCCNNVFCLECITMALSTSKECPLCRAKIKVKDVNLIINDSGSTTTKVEDEKKLLTKMVNLVNLVKKDTSKRIMIFSEYDESLNNIRQELDDLNINYSGIKGASSTIQGIISNFKDRKFNVLLLNAKHFGAGLNLQFTDEIIIYHRMSKDLEKQVIGRAQRLGRKTPLQISYLCYDNEYS